MKTEPVVLESTRIRTPIGDLVGFVRDGALCALEFVDGRGDPLSDIERRFGAVALREGADPLGLKDRFSEYVAGRLEALDALRVDPGGTPFQHKVWVVLREIPPGSTASYAEIARRVGAPDAVRAVGAANGRNPVAIVIPCHRVVCSDGSLGGYGGGLARKRWLLDHEKARLLGLRPGSSQGTLFPG